MKQNNTTPRGDEVVEEGIEEAGVWGVGSGRYEMSSALFSELMGVSGADTSWVTWCRGTACSSAAWLCSGELNICFGIF